MVYVVFVANMPLRLLLTREVGYPFDNPTWSAAMPGMFGGAISPQEMYKNRHQYRLSDGLIFAP